MVLVKYKNLIIFCLAICCLSGGLFLSLKQFYPEGTVSLIDGSTPPKLRTLPYYTKSNEKIEYDLQVKINLPHDWFRDLIVSADDCLLNLKVNEIEVEPSRLPYCNWSLPIDFHDVSAIKVGENIIQARIGNLQGLSSFNIRIVPSQTIKIIRWTLLVASFFLLAYLVAFRLWPDLDSHYFSFLFGLAVSLRLLYFLATPAGIRAYDLNDHMDYVKHSLNTFALPAAIDGWEFYQPPLYYWIISISIHLLRLFHFPATSLSELAMLITFVISLFTVTIGFAALVCSQSGKNSRGILLTGAALIATFPGLIMSTVRVNNDSLAIAMATTCLWCVMNWWKTDKFSWWLAGIFAFCLGVLSKLNILTILPVIVLLPFLKKRFSPEMKIKHLATGLGLILFVTLSYGSVRFLNEGKSLSVLGNAKSPMRIYDKQLFIRKVDTSFVTFNPKAIIEFPKAHSRNDQYRRWAFLEYLFKTAFFGEFDIPPSLLIHAKLLLFSGMLALPLLLVQLVLINSSLPIVLFILTGFAGVVFFRYRSLVSPSQDFRYLSPMATGICILMSQSIGTFKSALWRFYAYLSIYALILLQATYLVRLCLLEL